jgi:hypothetical protein
MTSAAVRGHGAQIVFVEFDSVQGPRRWQGRLLRPSSDYVDTETGRKVTWTPVFDIMEHKTGRCTVRMQGGPHKSGRRYASYIDVTAAQKAGIRWAKRRFRTVDSARGGRR